MHWVNSVLNNINWVHSASSFEKAQRTKPGAMQTFALPPSSSKMFHPAREPRLGRRTKRTVTTGKYLHCLYQVSIILGEGQRPLALPPRRGCSSCPWLFHSHPSLLCVTSSHPDPFLIISSPRAASGLTSFTQLWRSSSPAPSFGLTHGQRAIQAHYLVVVAGECYTICKIVLPIKYLVNHPLAEAFPVEALEPLAHSQVSLCSPCYPN